VPATPSCPLSNLHCFHEGGVTQSLSRSLTHLALDKPRLQVRADLEVASRLACRGFTVASIKGPEGSRATTPRSIDPSEVRRHPPVLPPRISGTIPDLAVFSALSTANFAVLLPLSHMANGAAAAAPLSHPSLLTDRYR
jgi:hypothetical protein